MSRPVLLFLLVTACLHANFLKTEKIPVILDTDIGTDIDDAFALALALASPELEVRGVTTVSSDAYTRASMVCRFLHAVGHPRIPVAAGSPPRPHPEFEGQYQYGLRPARKHPLRRGAVEFLYQELKSNPGEITIITAGDLTNIARLITEHPESKPWIRRIALMGGSIRIGYKNKPPPDREWNIRSDVKGAQVVFQSGLPLVVAPLDATTQVKLTGPLRRRIFETDTALCQHLYALYQLWGKETPTLFDPVAVALAFNETFFTLEDLRIEVDAEGYTREVAGIPNCRAATGVQSEAFLQWYVSRIMQAEGKAVRQPVTSGKPTNLSRLVPPRGLPYRVHVVEDYETDIERRWWLAGKPVGAEGPGGGQRACRALLCRDFDGRMGNQDAIYKAVIFNPVPGPPMGRNTRLSFRYRLTGTDTIRVQIYTLSKNYHRHLTVTGLPQGSWREATVDMTAARCPDGSGGPLSEDERIDDIQFYIHPGADLLIDDIVLYDEALPGETRAFPRKIHFTGWFDTGKQGQEWPGEFEIVPHEKPLTWFAARALLHPETKHPWIRVHLRGQRTLGLSTKLRFRYRVEGGGNLEIALVNSGAQTAWRASLSETVTGKWAEEVLDFSMVEIEGGRLPHADEILFRVPQGRELWIDDILLYESD